MNHRTASSKLRVLLLGFALIVLAACSPVEAGVHGGSVSVLATWEGAERDADLAVRNGTKPWCVGMESGEASGWPGTDWIEDIVLRQSGPAVYDDWVSGKIRWSSPPIRQAFELFAHVIGPDSVYGGADAVVG